MRLADKLMAKDFDRAEHEKVRRSAIRLTKGMISAGTRLEQVKTMLIAGHTDLDEIEVDEIMAGVKPAAAPVVRESLRIQSAGTIRNLDLAPLQWAADQLFPTEGVVLLAGRPKEGKSWLALQMALAISAGRKVMGRFDVIQSGVLYMALEDNDRRIKERLNTLDVPGSDDVAFAYDFTLDDVGIEELERVVEAQRFKVVIVDTFLNADGSPPAGRSADLVKEDYKKINLLKKLAFRLHICIVLVCHTRKKVKGDESGSLDQVLGTTGITAAADIIIMLEGISRENGKRTSHLHVTGKDVVITDALAMTLDPVNGGWQVDGIAGLTDLSKERQEILELIKSSGPGGAYSRQIQERLDKSKTTVNKHIKHLMKHDVIDKLRGGGYVILTADQKALF